MRLIPKFFSNMMERNFGISLNLLEPVLDYPQLFVKFKLRVLGKICYE